MDVICYLMIPFRMKIRSLESPPNPSVKVAAAASLFRFLQVSPNLIASETKFLKHLILLASCLNPEQIKVILNPFFCDPFLETEPDTR